LPAGVYFMASEDDTQLIAECLRGDASAFEPLVTKYQRVLFNVALRMLNDYEDARDVTQVTFLKAYQKLHTYDRRHKFFSWLYRILVNESLNALRGRKPQEALDARLAASNGPLEAAQAAELSERIQAALRLLPMEQRAVVVLRHFAGLSYGEMALALRLPEKTVKSRLFTARRRLGELLRPGSAS
jgi:RNA polymerase sigma-70 factor (ECF subfamily)